MLYPSWIAAAALLVGLLNGVEDDSARKSAAGARAGAAAVTALQAMDARRYEGYEPVTVAYSGRRESGGPARWVVLCDTRERSGLRRAVVVEIAAGSGKVIRVRRVGNGE